VKRVHLVCNSHIDPVWLWEWPEGAGEALATFRTAARLCEEFDDFVFCHNEAVLYQWVEEYEPELFAKIRDLVAQGKWNILGGWFLQPDCNMPSGESFVRQIILGKRYFREKFGVDVKTGSNLDPFGHSRGLVQVLARSGYHSYVFCRPDRTFAKLPAEEFIWVGYDGSEVLAARAEAHYNSREGGARAKVEDWLRTHGDKAVSLLLWGVGNHGGGASRRDLQDLADLKRAERDFEVVHSTPEAFFGEVGRDRGALPRHAKDINPWAPGCYTTMARVKQRHRRLENELFSAEKMAAAAAFQRLMVYPEAELREAGRDLAFSEFHDILPGSSIGPAEEGAIRRLDHGLELCSRVKTRAFFALAAGEAAGADGEIPIFAYNPHPFAIRGILECELEGHEPNFSGGFLVPRIYDRKGKPLPCQPEKEISHLSVEWRKRVAFEAELEPGRLSRFSCRLEKTAEKPRPVQAVRDGAVRFQTRDLDVLINAGTGLLDRYRVRGVDILAPNACRLIVVRDNADPWGMTVRGFRDVLGAFALMDEKTSAWFAGVSCERLEPVRVIEDGDVRTVVESLLAFGRSQVCLRYALPKRGSEIEVEVRVFWNEKDRMLKLSFPIAFSASEFLGQVVYGRDALPANGEEAVSQKWQAVTAEDGRAFTIINDCVYGSDFAETELRVSLLRSAAHATDPVGEHVPPCQDRFIPRIDQGERIFHFWINGGDAVSRLEAVDREALAKNETPYCLPYFPPGKGKKSRPFVVLEDPAVVMTALKKAEDGKDLIIRLFEPTGRPRTAGLALPALRARTDVSLRGFEVKTLRFDKKTKMFREVDLLEDPV
jgi:alpha-mannosidase